MAKLISIERAFVSMGGRSLTSLVFVFAIILAVSGVTGCGQKGVVKRKPLVVTSFFPLYDFARQIGGTNVEVLCLVPPGGDPHAAEPTPAAAKEVSQADLVLLLGLGMDGWVEKLSTAEHKVRVVTLTDGLPVRHLGRTSLAEFSKDAPDANEIDPHVWLDPVLAQTLSQRITDELVKLAPQSRGEIEARSKAYLAELQKLNQDYTDVFAKMANHRVVTFHGAFGYLFSRYNLEVVAVIEEFPGNEPSAEYLRKLVDLIRKSKVKIVFAEPQLPDRPAQIIAREIDGRVERLDPCETILPEAPQATYIDRQQKNLATLHEVLTPP
jgi:zinc transport system substrate-binding protein